MPAAVIVAAVLLTACIADVRAERTTLSLDGQWNIAYSANAAPPASFPSKTPVPGLADMAEPPFKDVGKPSKDPGYFYYRRTFKAPEALPEFALLKIHKASSERPCG